MKALAVFLLIALSCQAQKLEQRGFLELRSTAYPQTAINDSGRIVGEGLLRWEGTYTPSSSLKFFTAFDARSDTHQQVERVARFDLWDRSPRRPALSLRRAAMQWHRGGFTLEAGKQFIRWGKADILNPTDRFAPRDYLGVVDNDFLGIWAGRFTYEHGGDTLDAVVSPRFTPSRTPLLNQRWAVLPAGISFDDLGAHLPGRTQFGLRWNHVGRRFEGALVFYDGFHHLPILDVPRFGAFVRNYPRLRLYGGDLAVPVRWFTVKAEAAWFTSATRNADEYALYVLQLERITGEWVFTGGYAGEAVTARRNPLTFAPDRGFAKSFLGRAGYTIDARRSFAFEAAIRQNGDGSWLKGEYSQQFGTHWRATASLTWIRGEPADFLGRYRRNSHGLLALRYSF